MIQQKSWEGYNLSLIDWDEKDVAGISKNYKENKNEIEELRSAVVEAVKSRIVIE